MIFFTKKLRRLYGLLAAILLLLSFQQAFAQTQTVTGTILDADTNEPLPGATIVVKGTTSGVAADIKGAFKIGVSTNATLEIKSIGYTTVTLTADASKPMQIKLSGVHKDLNEVVVIGYGSAQKKDLTGSVSIV